MMTLKINGEFSKSLSIIKDQKNAKFNPATKNWTVEPNDGAIDHGQLGRYISLGYISIVGQSSVCKVEQAMTLNGMTY